MTPLKLDEKGLIAAIIQDEESGEVLMLAYMDKTAVERTLKEKKTVFYSRSKQRYWVKGESSGHTHEKRYPDPQIIRTQAPGSLVLAERGSSVTSHNQCDTLLPFQ